MCHVMRMKESCSTYGDEGTKMGVVDDAGLLACKNMRMVYIFVYIHTYTV